MPVLCFLSPTDVLKASQVVFLTYEMFSPSHFQTSCYMEIKGKNGISNQNESIPFLMLNHHLKKKRNND